VRVHGLPSRSPAQSYLPLAPFAHATATKETQTLCRPASQQPPIRRGQRANRRRILLRKTRQLHRRMRLTTTARIQNICLKKNLATRARAQLGLRGAASRKARLRPRLRMEIREITGEFKLIGNYFRLISLSFPPPPPPLSRVAPHLRSLPPPSRSTPHHAPTRRRPPRGTPEAGIGPLTPPASRTRRLGRPPSSPGWWVLPAPSLSLSSPLLSWMQLRFATSSSPSPSNLRFRAFADFAPGACFFFWPFIGCVFFWVRDRVLFNAVSAVLSICKFGGPNAGQNFPFFPTRGLLDFRCS
jgi:hypothetical protein